MISTTNKFVVWNNNGLMMNSNGWTTITIITGSNESTLGNKPVQHISYSLWFMV